MKIGITPLIAENFVPSNVSGLAIFNGDTKICDVDISKMQLPNIGTKLYSFGLVSDVHIAVYSDTSVAWKPRTKFDNALTYFENSGCEFCCVCGDLTQTGLYCRTDESDASTTYLDEGQLTEYKRICDKHPSLPVYEIAGNHESYYSMPIKDNLIKWESYTGKDVLHYTVERQNDVFIFCGQPRGSDPMTDEAFTFLSDTLSANSNKRCFVFVHPVWNDDSGDANGIYANHSSGGGTLLSSWSKGAALKNLLKQYPKAVLFHGHTHIKFEEQAKDKSLNYTKKNGFHSVHIPSIGRPREIIDDELVYAPSESQGYIVDVYENCIVLNGWDFVSNMPIPLGTLKIDT